MAFHMEAKTEGKLLFRQRDHRDVSFSKTEFNSGLPRPGLVELNKPPTISSLPWTSVLQKYWCNII